MSESALQARILNALKDIGVLAWRVNSGVAKRGGRRIRMAPIGTPDIVGALRVGRMFGIECKKPKRERGGDKKPTVEAQAAWERMALANGVLYARVHTWEEFAAVWATWTKDQAFEERMGW